MVNAGVPGGPVWFRNGGYAQPPRAAAESRHQSKIYTESNHSDFSQIFGDLTTMQILAIYRQLLVKDRLRDHRNGCEVSQRDRKRRKRDVFPAPHGILARAGARAVAQREDV